MGYTEPPLIAAVNIPVTNVVGNTVIIVAPGLGAQLRLVGGHCKLAQNAGAGNYDVELQDGAGGAALARFTVTTNQRWIPFPVPEPGLVLTENTLLNAQRLGSIAGPVTVQVIIYYYIDAIS